MNSVAQKNLLHDAIIQCLKKIAIFSQLNADELDLMAALAQSQPGCWGARMTGAGFGGCVVALVNEDVVDGFSQTVASLYARQALRTPAVYICYASAGASIEQKAR